MPNALPDRSIVLQGGFYDNNKGLDYHVPVKGGAGAMPQLRVVHVAAEMAPIAKVRAIVFASVCVRAFLACGGPQGQGQQAVGVFATLS